MATDLDTLKDNLKSSFLRIRNDMQDLKSQLEKLSEKNLQLKQRVSELETDSRLREENQEDKLSIVSPPETKGSQSVRRNQSPQEIKGSQRLRQNEKLKPFEKEFLKQLHKNKKQVIQNYILNALQEKSMSPWDLKELIVDKSKYCSKASFYRYLKELVKAGYIEEVNGKGTAILKVNNINI